LTAKNLGGIQGRLSTESIREEACVLRNRVLLALVVASIAA